MILSIYLLIQSFNGKKGKSANLFKAFSVLFFLVELVVLYYAVSLAIKCSAQGPERVINVILAVTVTIPYMLLNMLLNQCVKTTISTPSSSMWIPRGAPSE